MQLSVEFLFYIIPAIFIGMAVHEAMHAFTSHWLGDTTAKDAGRLTLNPLAHIDLITTVLLPVGLILVGLPPIFIAKPVPFDPENVKFQEFGSALIGIAGPLSNLTMAGIASILIKLVALPEVLFNFLIIFVMVNIAFFVFNMIPFPPLDGSRLLYAFAPEPLQRVMMSIENMGFMAILLFFVFVVQFIGPVIELVNNFFLKILL